MVRKQEMDGWMDGERTVLSALALMEEFILDQRQVKLKENQDVGSITEVAVLKAHGANKNSGDL